MDRADYITRVGTVAGALRGGGEGYEIGTVRFIDADGQDVTAASVPLPDVIHGVPRSHGCGVEGGLSATAVRSGR